MNTRTVFLALAVATLGACATSPNARKPDDLAGVGGDAVATPTRPGTDTPAPHAPAAIAAPAPVWSGALQSQDYSPGALYNQEHGDFMARSERYEPAFRASFLFEPDGEIDGDPGDFDQTKLSFEGTHNLIVDPDTVLILGGNAEMRRYEFSSNFGAPDETLGAIGLHLGAGHFFNSDTYAEVVFSPGIYSDFGGTLKSEDWQFYGEGLLSFRYADDVYLKGGVKVSGDFRDAPVFPMLGLSWLFDPQWRLDILAPLRAELAFEPDSATILYGGIEVEGQEFRVRSSAATGKQPLDYHLQEVRLYVGGIRRFDDHFSAFARVGTTLAGDHKFETPGGGRIQGSLEPTLLLEVGIGWDF